MSPKHQKLHLAVALPKSGSRRELVMIIFDSLAGRHQDVMAQTWRMTAVLILAFAIAVQCTECRLLQQASSGKSSCRMVEICTTWP